MADQASPTLRLDPSPSQVFSWLHWRGDAPEVRNEAGRLIQPSGPSLHVRYRTTGAEWEFWPVSESEARAVMFPGHAHDFSIGRAFSDIVKSHKSSRQVKQGDRQVTTKQREETEQRAGRRWLA